MDNREVTIYDIAKALNISAATVSRGLKDHPAIRKETKERIRQAARIMGYQQNTFARNLRNNSTKTIGVMVPRLNSYFVSSVLAGIENVANREGYNLIISQSSESSEKESANIHAMYNSRIDGILVSLAADTQDDQPFDVFHKKNIPMVYFDRAFQNPDTTRVVIDNVQAGYDATHHLIEQGCKRIVHIGGNQNRNVYVDRFNGYKRALSDGGIPFNPGYFITIHLNEEFATKTADAILRMDPLPDGIFAANDTSAVTLISVFKSRAIKIPEEIAIVGFNNDPIASVVDPSLTTINYPGIEMGEAAATTLINKIRKQSGPNLSTILLNHKLIVRESSSRMKYTTTKS